MILNSDLFFIDHCVRAILGSMGRGKVATQLVVLLLTFVSLKKSVAVKKSIVHNLRAQNQDIMLPIVLWHGMGDSCQGSMVGLKRLILEDMPQGATVYCISTGSSFVSDIMSSYIGNINSQIDRACDRLKSIPELHEHGYIGIGVSQGAQILRGVVQRCNHLHDVPTMISLISLGGQHNGVSNIPSCGNARISSTFCSVLAFVLGKFAYAQLTQSHSIQAQYFKDPTNLDLYYLRSGYLADINAEQVNGDLDMYKIYKDNLLQLRALVLVQFDNDSMVVPKESSHFGFYDGDRVISMNETIQFELLGLRELEQSGRLHLLHVEGDHLQFTDEWFRNQIIRPYLQFR